MKALVCGQWTEGFLDYHRRPEGCRIKVLACLTLTKIDELYFVRSGSVRLIWNYVRQIGFRNVYRKIRSRRDERVRNEKFLSIGLGSMLEPGDDFGLRKDELILFIAPSYPMCAERFVLPADLIRAIDITLPVEIQDNAIIHSQLSDVLPACLQELAGWNAFSGTPLRNLQAAFDAARAILIQPSVWAKVQRLSVDPSDLPLERRDRRRSRECRRKQGVLFGYGNYAKVVVLPNVAPYVEISCIHEVDPLQIPIREKADVTWDTASDLRSAEKYDAYFIAGFHHSHAPLAIKALRLGACVVVEKPLAVDNLQLSELLDAMTLSDGTLYCGFHKRYQILNEHAYQDLGLRPGEPVSYHCIVYEVPLPSRHWYRWPNSKSRLVSNGCHWIDHFLFLNNYCEVSRGDLFLARDGTINCSMELANGAYFTMVLTDQGSERIGVQDYIELRANGVTARMRNGATYEAESNNRILRRLTINKMDSYRRMYRSIGQKIAQGVPGDTIESVRVSTSAVFLLEQQLNAITKNRNVAWV
jgi:predicted dehydrogenase